MKIIGFDLLFDIQILSRLPQSSVYGENASRPQPFFVLETAWLSPKRPRTSEVTSNEKLLGSRAPR